MPDNTHVLSTSAPVGPPGFADGPRTRMTDPRRARPGDVLAVIGEGADTLSLIALAEAIGVALTATVRRITLSGAAMVPQAKRVLGELAQPSTLLGVLSGVEQPDNSGWRLLQRAVKPVVVVPACGWPRTRAIGRALVPLDGTPESAAATWGQWTCSLALASRLSHFTCTPPRRSRSSRTTRCT